MKKLYLVGLIGLSVLSVNAQQQIKQQPKATSSASIKRESVNDVPRYVPGSSENHKTTDTRKSERLGKADGVANVLVGKTFIVNQTNNSIYRRILAYPDGKLSLTWTASIDNGTNGFASRGSGYNSFDGSAWSTPPASANGLRIEANYRAGFPCIVAAPNNEIIISHRVDTSGESKGLIFNQNQAVGSTTWGATSIFEPAAGTPSQLWPRAAVSGDYLIVIASYTDSSATQPNKVFKNGVERPLVYSRYQFSTSTWVEQDLTLPGYDSTLLLQGGNDNYSIDANGNDVAILLGGIFNSLVLWKSSDNGASWTRTIIDTFPVPNYKFDRDTLPQTAVNNGSVHVLVDNGGKAHVFSGLAMVQDTIMDDGFYTYTYARYVGGVNDAIIYWNEYTQGELRIIAKGLISSIDGDSTITAASFSNENRRYGISNSTWPSAGIDTSGRIFLTYSALTVGDATADPALYRDILVVYSSDNGATWSTPLNITEQLGFNREEAYPSVARNVTDKVNITYLKKEFPGSNIPSANNEEFEIHHLSVPVQRIIDRTVGVAEVEKLFSTSYNYPNPFNGSTYVDVTFKRSANATVKITDITGKEIYSNTFNNIPAGISTLELNVGETPVGLYFYSIEAEGLKTVGKMLIN